MRFAIHVKPDSHDHETKHWAWSLSINPSSNRYGWDPDDLSGGWSANSVPERYRGISEGEADTKRLAISHAKAAAKEIDRRMTFDERFDKLVEEESESFVYETKPRSAVPAS